MAWPVTVDQQSLPGHVLTAPLMNNKLFNSIYCTYDYFMTEQGVLSLKRIIRPEATNVYSAEKKQRV